MATNNTYSVQGTLSSTSNDVYIQTPITTGLTGQDNTAFRIKELILEHPLVALTSTKSEVQLTRGSKASIVTLADASLIIKDERYNLFITSGAYLQEQIKDIVPQGDLIVVESVIYLGFKTTAMAALATIGFKIIFEEVKISSEQRLTILSQRLP